MFKMFSIIFEIVFVDVVIIIIIVVISTFLSQTDVCTQSEISRTYVSSYS